MNIINNIKYFLRRTFAGFLTPVSFNLKLRTNRRPKEKSITELINETFINSPMTSPCVCILCGFKSSDSSEMIGHECPALTSKGKP